MAPIKTKKAGEAMTLAAVMAELKKNGSAQTAKIYARHGAGGSIFGVSFATLKTLMKRIRVDHELAMALWDTGNFDARNLAVKVVDPQRMTVRDLERWAKEAGMRTLASYVGGLAAESPHGETLLASWLGSRNERLRCAGWQLLSCLAMRSESIPDRVFEKRLADIERTIHAAPNGERHSMNAAMIAIGCRSAALRAATLAASRRIGRVEVDHGETACETPDAAAYIAKTWAHSTSKGFPTPAAHERSRELLRLRC
jgi:3-methyladenine DNA glycosylase AlkD